MKRYAWLVGVVVFGKFIVSLQIVGTDIAQSVLEKAQAAVYGRYSFRGTPAYFIQKYFDPVGPDAQSWAGVPMIGGLAVLAVGGHRARAWPTWSSASVGLACVVVVVLVGYGFSTAIDRMAGGVLLTVAGTAFVPAWLGLGATLLSPRLA